MPHAFISYVRENSQTVDRLADDLRRSGVTVWLDRESLRPGELWSEAIKNAITQGGFFLACFSREFSLRKSTYMTEELMLAADQLVREGYQRTWFIPVLLNECEIPHWPITSELSLRSFQQVDLAKDWREGVLRLITLIQPVRAYGKLRERPYEPRINPAKFRIGLSPIAAIDFGTSYSSIALYTESRGFVPVPDYDGRTLIPSVVTFTDNWDYLVGFDAVAAAEHNPDRSITNIKRLLGSDFVIKLAHKQFAPETIASLIIEALKRAAERYLGVELSKAVAAVPTDFSTAQSQSLVRAFRLAGMEVIRLVGEPNAAVLSVLPWLERKQKITTGSLGDLLVLVIDMGGGTTDITLATVGEGIADVDTTVGDANLGGVDYDNALFGFIRRREIVPLTGKGLSWSTSNDRRLLQELSRGKILLSNSPEVALSLGDFENDNGFVALQFHLSRSDMRDAVGNLDRRVEALIDRCLKLASRNAADLHAVLLAGQGSKIFTVAEIVRKKFFNKEFVDSLQEKSVLTGLATQSGVLSGECKDVLLLETVYRPLLLRCAATATKDKALHVTISCRSEKNTLLVDTGLRSVPSKIHIEAKFSGNGPATLRFFEASTADPNETLPIGEVILEKVADGEAFTIVVDIDANRVLGVKVISSANQVVANRILWALAQTI